MWQSNVDGPSAPEPVTGRDPLETLIGGRGHAALGRVRSLYARVGLARASRFDAATLCCEAGVTPSQAARIEAAFELGRAAERARRRPSEPLHTAARVARLMRPELRGLERESFHVLLLDTKHRLLDRARVSEGTLTSSLVHPREVFRPAIRQGAAALVVVHNHPSGDPEPSTEDESVTRRLIDAGKLIGIPLLDHVIVADGGWTSLRQRIEFE